MITAKELVEVLEKVPVDTPIFMTDGDDEDGVLEIEIEAFYGRIRKVVLK